MASKQARWSGGPPPGPATFSPSFPNAAAACGVPGSLQPLLLPPVSRGPFRYVYRPLAPIKLIPNIILTNPLLNNQCVQRPLLACALPTNSNSSCSRRPFASGLRRARRPVIPVKLTMEGACCHDACCTCA